MNCHQVLSGACNSGDQCFAVGSVEGIPFTAYAAGCNIVILASNFERVQIIPGAVHGYVRISTLDCSTDTGKIAAAYGAEVCVFEPIPLVHTTTTHGLEYRWVQTGKLTAAGPIAALSWNLEGTRLLTGSEMLQLWHQASMYEDDNQSSSGVTFQIGGGNESEKEKPPQEEQTWICVWKCHTASPAYHLAFSPDGTLFATSGLNDRLVKIWYHNKILMVTKGENALPNQELSYEFIYVAHPRAITQLSWRKTSKYMPKGSVGNVLVTSCRDNICRVWSESLLPDDESAPPPPHRAGRPHRRRATHRHKHRFMQRLKHMKACFHIRRTAATNNAPLPTLPSTYSVHDFHTPYHNNTYSAGLHFHLAASINAETDIPLVPSIQGSGDDSSRFILHWLNNKEMHFTAQAETLLHELTKKILEKEEADEGVSAADSSTHQNGEPHHEIKSKKHVFSSKTHSQDESNSDEHHTGSTNPSHPSLSNTTSINSIATDVTCTYLPDSLDAKIEALLRDWHQSPDLMFSIHPVDGSFLIWTAEWLDEVGTGGLRQASVSFSARIPAAFPLGDATTMRTDAHLYHTSAHISVRRTIRPTTNDPPPVEPVSSPLASVQEEKEDVAENEQETPNENGEPTDHQDKTKHNQQDTTEPSEGNEENDVLSTAPVISMVTNHNNGSLNLWQLTFDDKSKFTQVLSIGHASRASGHRFRVNDITCHPVLPLLLTTSHHNIADNAEDPKCMSNGSNGDTGGLCSELILWRVEAVGPLGKSGGVSELARVSSPHLSAFSNVAWIPTLLPSSTLGNLTNSPSACFVASDGESLRVYQAVIDARTLLAEIASAERRHRKMTDSMETLSDCSSEEGIEAARLELVSSQSTARPGAVLKRHAINDATHDWHNTQLLHVFQKRLITGEGNAEGGVWSDEETGSKYHEPFYIVVLERTNGGTTVHMWQLTVSSLHNMDDDLTTSMMYVPDSRLVQEEEVESRKNSVSMDPGLTPKHMPKDQLHISTTKVCECPLPLPDGVEVIHAAPAAGHLSSASIYPACLAPYSILTACSDSTIRFWKCELVKGEDDDAEDYRWAEWEMASDEKESAIDVPGQPLNVSAAYSGRVACAYKCGRSFTRGLNPNASESSGLDEARFVNLCVCVYECESSGGAEWTLEDTIPLKNVSLPRISPTPDLDLSYLNDSSFMQKRQRLSQFLQNLSSSHEDNRSTRNGENGLNHDSGKTATGLLTVPSFSTLQSLRKSITENGNTCPLTQKHLVQLDWVSKEDGSHILTVAVGSKVLLFTSVSTDLAQANLKAMKESINNNRPMLRKASSLAVPMFADEIRWMKLRAVELQTADGLPPLPMQISWVRDGILVVGMDSEMHVYSQWKPDMQNSGSGLSLQHKQSAFGDESGGEDMPEARELRDVDLRTSLSHLQRVSSINLQLLERDNKRRKDKPQPVLDYMPDYGLFEASQMACPVLPQYHPKQLMELLNSGKIRWVKAILAHLVRCIGGSIPPRASQGDDDSVSRQRMWSRSRTLSVSFGPGATSPLDVTAQLTEDTQLDYAEITSIPPLPLWTLLVADKESPGHPTSEKEAKDYNELFDGAIETEDDLDDLLNEDDDATSFKQPDRRASMPPERQGLSHFGPRQGRILSRLLTHTHLPGLSSLDQMHLLALADTVSTCDSDFADRLALDANNTQKPGAATADALDDCGLRFLLAMKHYGYLLRCLPIAQRAALQRTGLSTANIAWAFHSQSHEQLLNLLPGYLKGDPKWQTLKELGVGWWVRSPALVRTCMECVARAAYQRGQDPMDAALYYLAMKKKALLWGLFRSRRDEKMTAFFSNNFSEERWRKAALKNAYALLGKQRFEHAAAFFLLGGALKDALEVLITRLEDFQLAMIVARLYNPESMMPDSLRQLLLDEILGGGGEAALERSHPDPFIRSMALWQLGKHTDSLETLLATGAGRMHPLRQSNQAPQPSAFNFYVYLRTHPVLKRSIYGVSQAERRLYFGTAHTHLTAGCPALALHVLSKLPTDYNAHTKHLEKNLNDHQVVTGEINWDSEKQIKEPDKSSELGPSKAADMDWGASAVDWSEPLVTNKEEELVLKWEDEDEADRSSDSPPPLQFKSSINTEEGEKEMLDTEADGDEKGSNESAVDIMSQQLKFIACLKILMEELSTLATGFEVDGGHLRYQLYIWLEREVEALRSLCNYSYAGDGSDSEQSPHLNIIEHDYAPMERLTLHQVLLQEKLDFEAKVQRAVMRKRWLKANERLLRTLLSYCSLQGLGGGGLASVRMELVLLLQELGQDERRHRLLSPLPLPTTLPLLSSALHAPAAVSPDPCKLLQAQAHDMLATLSEMSCSISAGHILFTLRDLGIALSACIYQSLCDTFTVKQFQINGMGENLVKLTGSSGQNSHLLGHRQRRFSIDEFIPVTTPPNKWPGVSWLRALCTRAAEEEDAPRLRVLLTEAYAAVYSALLTYALANRDARLLWRLTAARATPQVWARIFGGGARVLLRAPQKNAVQEQTTMSTGASMWSSLKAQRHRLNMKLLGSGVQAQVKMDEARPTYREQFVPPATSILSYLLNKPTPDEDVTDWNDYDSNESIPSEPEEEEEEDDDVFDSDHNIRVNPKPVRRENTEHSDPDSFAWLVMRLAVMKLAQHRLQEFLQVAGIEMSELATTSPMIHGALRRLAQWAEQLTETLSQRTAPADFIPGIAVDRDTHGPPLNKYRCLLEKQNTPFNPSAYSAGAAKRLWLYLVHQEQVQDVFIRAVFSKRIGVEGAALDDEIPSDDHTDSAALQPVRIIHKEQDSISAFCINQTGGGLMAVATAHEVAEMDISLLLRGAGGWKEDECEVDLIALAADPAALPDTGFLLVRAPNQNAPAHVQAQTQPTAPYGMASQSGRGASVQPGVKVINRKVFDGGSSTDSMKGLQFPGCHDAKYCRLIIHRSKLLMRPVLKHKIDNIKRMSAHPSLPLYLTGGQDGSVQLWEWGHNNCVCTARVPGAFSKVTRVRFSELGNKFGVADGDGNLALWQLATTKPFVTLQCHSKGISDFAFLGSCSLIATAGHSSENKNVAIWDTLLPAKKSLVVSWTCHEGGAACVAQAGGALVSGGRKGDVVVWDVRGRLPRHRHHAHDAPLKCLALAPHEDKYATGAADGDIKVWSLVSHQLLHCFVGEHARSSFFKNIGQGVTQIHIDNAGRMFSCGADGTMKVRQLPEQKY